MLVRLFEAASFFPRSKKAAACPSRKSKRIEQTEVDGSGEQVPSAARRQFWPASRRPRLAQGVRKR